MPSPRHRETRAQSAPLGNRALRALAGILWLSLLGLLAALPARATNVDIVLGEQSPVYLGSADLLSQELGGAAHVRVLSLESVARPGPPLPNADLLVTFGSRAFLAALDLPGKTPIVAALVPRQTYERAARTQAGAHPTTAVFLDQPTARQLRLVRLVLPGKSRVGILATAESQDLARNIESAAREQKLTVVRETLTPEQDLYASLKRVLAESELLLALPDSAIYNGATIHNILLTTYRSQQPVIGFSPAYVRAGALAAVYSTPAQTAQQIALVALRVLAGGSLPPPEHPRDFSVAINAQVARSLSLQVDDEATLEGKLRRMEREP